MSLLSWHKKYLVSEADLINGSGVKTCRILFVVSTVKSQNASLLFPQNAWRQRNHSWAYLHNSDGTPKVVEVLWKESRAVYLFECQTPALLTLVASIKMACFKSNIAIHKQHKGIREYWSLISILSGVSSLKIPRRSMTKKPNLDLNLRLGSFLFKHKAQSHSQSCSRYVISFFCGHTWITIRRVEEKRGKNLSRRGVLFQPPVVSLP